MAAKSISKGLPVDLSECISFAAVTIALRTTWKKKMKIFLEVRLSYNFHFEGTPLK